MMLQSFENFQLPNLQDAYDVVICGGGIAGITLARQLRLNLPKISILVCDRLARPLPEATFKVGESTVEIGAHYFTETLQLKDYIQQYHLPKLGLRYFVGDPQAPFGERPEIGVRNFEIFHSDFTYQLDRGKLENDLRNFNIEAGIDLLENCSIQDVKLTDGEEFHTVIYKKLDTKETQSVKARWVVDATGRRRLLQNKLGLGKANAKNRSAVWFRLDGRVDVSDLVPLTESKWHAQVPNNLRYYSTNHLMGEGYWVWLIPLSSGCTSVGIVASDEVHNFHNYHTYEKACQWLQKHEPALADYLKDRQPKDFMKIPKYSHSSHQVFSQNRWACVGEAAAFVDPLFSPGFDLIFLANSLTTELIKLDLNNKLSQRTVDHANVFYIDTIDQLNLVYENIYALIGKKPITFALQSVWGALVSWSTLSTVSLNSVILDPDRMAKFQPVLAEIYSLAHRVQQLLNDWSDNSSNRLKFEYFDYLGELPFVDEMRSLHVKFNKTDQELINGCKDSLKLLEELAQVIFLLAVEDTMPEKLQNFSQPIWLNAWGISLNPDQWEQDGLFEPKSLPRDLNPVMAPLRKSIYSNYQPYVLEVERETANAGVAVGV
ncbi:NAD(P)/FAD-dependent oxidoreductase [Gloeothece verrucosa]|uniref:FAD dependent oxidoreductase n=1 Tax=Gloeothece verrucosa (strain PCC 7822) TaxID=497965 RepID=E0ULN9_GLOV7|nr:tryptophan 7-halogenase [Gloeothece verrucosa]ADN17869.1 FAD dependent oxidoreductase [Gloeothece verrucosa PCC 7822]